MKTAFAILKPVVGVLMLVATMFGIHASSHAQQPDAVAISVKGHHFQPPEIRAPANKSIVLRVKHRDATPMEFESVSLRVEKVVAPGGEGSSTFVHLRQVGTSLLTTSIKRPGVR